MSQTRNQKIIGKTTDLFTGATFGAVVIYSVIACLQVLTVSVGV